MMAEACAAGALVAEVALYFAPADGEAPAGDAIGPCPQVLTPDACIHRPG